MSAVFESRSLAPTERLIMLALADHADDDGRCYPSILRLCQRTGLCERAVQTNIRKLSEQGYIKIVPGGGKGNANLYFVSANPAADAPLQHPNPAADAPRRKCTPAADAPQTPQQMRANPAADAPEPSRTIIGTVKVVVDGCARDADPTFRERLLEAMGVGPDGVAGPSRFIGGTADMAEAGRWLELPYMTPDLICEEITRITAKKRDGPPKSFTYFTEAMRRLSGQLSAPPLKPIEGNRHDHQPNPQLGRSNPGAGQQLSGLAGAAMRRRAAREQGHGS